MANPIIKLTDTKTATDYYLEWSSIVDAPITYGLSYNEFRAYYKKKYGTEGMKKFQERINKANEFGSSSVFFHPLDDLMKNNKAGKNEEHLSKEGILNNYCRERIA